MKVDLAVILQAATVQMLEQTLAASLTALQAVWLVLAVTALVQMAALAQLAAKAQVAVQAVA